MGEKERFYTTTNPAQCRGVAPYWAIITMQYFRKKNKQGERVEGIIFFKPPGIFKVLLYPWKFKKSKASPLETPQNCVTPHINYRTYNQDPWTFHMIFSWSPLQRLKWKCFLCRSFNRYDTNTGGQATCHDCYKIAFFLWPKWKFHLAFN